MQIFFSSRHCALLLLVLAVENTLSDSTGWLSLCVPSGGFFSCQGSFNYSGPFGGESVSFPDNWLAVDGDYSLVNGPTSYLRAGVQQSVLGTSTGGSNGVPYPLANYYSTGNCWPNSTSVNYFDSCGNFLGGSLVPSGWNSSYDLCGNTSNSYYGWICPINGGKGAVGLKVNGVGNLFVSNSSNPPTFFGNISYMLDGVAGSVISDLSVASDQTASMWIKGSVFPLVDSSVFPFWVVENGVLFIPNQSFLNARRSFVLGKNWIAGLVQGFDGVSSVTNNPSLRPADLISRRNNFCQDVDFLCNFDGSVAVYGSRIVSREFLSAASLNITSVIGNGHMLLISNNAMGNITATFGVRAIFKRLPPKVTLISYSIDTEEVGAIPVVSVVGNNAGNAGPVDVKIIYRSGVPTSSVYYASVGSFFVRIESSKVNKVCILDDCLLIDYSTTRILGGALSVSVTNSTIPADESLWFSVASPGLYAFEVIMIVVACVSLAFIGVFLVRKIRARGWRRFGKKVKANW